ncbi:MAG: class I SAM-dependent methyltransferase [Clostridia bacterium]
MNHYDTDKEYTYEEMEEIEKEIYDKTFFSINEQCNINFNSICARKPIVFKDRDYHLPQNIFIIKNYKGRTIVGRKIWSILSIENKINAINCSMITAPMLLGVLKNRQKTNRKITIEYFPFTNNEKKTIFDELKTNRKYDIYYPYKYRFFTTNKEEVSPEEGWSFNPDRKEYLGYGEIHLRNYTNQYFKSIDLTENNVYDPACSTGEFLSDFKKIHPSCYTIGHDLSQEMIDYAKDYVDESCCCNAMNSPLENNSVNIMFLRFLNSEVVSTFSAYQILKELLPKMKKNSKIICFGHTPVLITKNWFEKHNLKVLSCNGYDDVRNAIFQYYVLEVE